MPKVSERDIADLTNLKHLAPGLKMYVYQSWQRASGGVFFADI